MTSPTPVAEPEARAPSISGAPNAHDASSAGSDRASTPATLSRSATWRVAIVVTLVMSVSYIDRQTLAAIAPTVRNALAIDPEQYGLLTSAFSMAYLVGAPLAGMLIDRVGARRGLTVALLVWSVISGMHAFATSFAILFALRIALGTAEAPSFPGATQTMRRVLAKGDRSAGFGLLFTGSSIGAMIAAPLAIALNAKGGFRFAFIGTALVGLAWLPLWLFTTRSPLLRARLGGSYVDESVVALAVRAPKGKLAHLLASGSVLRAIVLVVASAPAIMFVLNWFPQYLVDAHGITQNGLAKYLWVPPLFFDAGAVVFGTLASRRDRASSGAILTHWPLTITAALLASSLAFTPLVHEAWPAVLLASTSLAGGGAIFALLTGDMLARVDPAYASTAGGLTAAAQSLAYVIASPLVGRVIKQTHSYDAILVVLGVAVLPGVLVWTFWPMNQPSRSASLPSPSTRT